MTRCLCIGRTLQIEALIYRDRVDVAEKVIVDDVTYFTEPMFQRSVIDSATKCAVDTNISYLRSAGNSASVDFEVDVSG
jgi:hypothetical protein